jgi:hypothetical protein
MICYDICFVMVKVIGNTFSLERGSETRNGSPASRAVMILLRCNTIEGFMV